MRKKIIVLLAVMLAPTAVPAEEESVSIVVARTSMRQDRQFFAPAVQELQYRQTVQVLERSGDWIRVQHDGQSGWIHQSAVTSKQVGSGGKKSLTSIFGSGSGRDASDVAGYSKDEVALAGKGFNEDVEQDFRRQDQQANYDAVDWIDRRTVPDFIVAEFAKAGSLSPRGTAETPDAGSDPDGEEQR